MLQEIDREEDNLSERSAGDGLTHLVKAGSVAIWELSTEDEKDSYIHGSVNRHACSLNPSGHLMKRACTQIRS